MQQQTETRFHPEDSLLVLNQYAQSAMTPGRLDIQGGTLVWLNAEAKEILLLIPTKPETLYELQVLLTSALEKNPCQIRKTRNPSPLKRTLALWWTRLLRTAKS